MKKLLCLMAMTVMLSMGALQAQAAEYPTRSITIVMPFAAGGIGDTSARILADSLQRELGQPVLVVNRTGGATIPGTLSGLRAAPDGYTIVAGSPGNAFSAAIFTEATRFDLDAMTFVAAYLSQDRIVMMRPDRPYKNWQEFVAYAKANPGRVSFGSGGSPEAMEAFRSAAISAGLELRYVMYAGGADAATDVLGGHIDLIEAGVGSPGFQAARKGELMILANLGYSEIPGFPGIPRLTELGAPFAAGLVFGFVFPQDTPEPIRLKWEQAIQKLVQDKEIIEKLEALGPTITFMTGAEYEAFTKKAIADVDAMIEFTKEARK
jgi:tripartite-type tricarboxylate transporter receptor subunit TctC